MRHFALVSLHPLKKQHMKPTFLKQFEYSILPSAIGFSEYTKHPVVAEHLPLMKAVIDFEQGKLVVEGNWQFIVSSNKYNDAVCLDYHLDRIYIQTSITASSEINLNDPESDGL